MVWEELSYFENEEGVVGDVDDGVAMRVVLVVVDVRREGTDARAERGLRIVLDRVLTRT